jgi:hypothetical protein
MEGCWLGPGGDRGDRGKVLHLAESRAAAESEYRSKLLLLMREALRSRHYSRRTEQTYCRWARKFILSASTQN